MILGSLRDFDWINEPKNVSFTENGLQVMTQSGTDFWQNVDCDFARDSGHFFATYQQNDFVLTAKWSFEAIKDSAQCGIMIRVNEHNWIKLGLLTTDLNCPQIGAVVANCGSCDWSMEDIPLNTYSLWFRLKRRRQDFVLSYSLDGHKFKNIRVIHLPAAQNAVRAGAYACSPKDTCFECVLEEIDIKSF